MKGPLSLPEDLSDEDLSNNENPFASDAHSLKIATPTRQLACLWHLNSYQKWAPCAIISLRGKLGVLIQ